MARAGSTRVLRGILLGLAAALAGVPAPGASQIVGPRDPLFDYLRLLQISGDSVPSSFMIRPRSAPFGEASASTDHPWSERLGAVASRYEAAGALQVTHDGMLLRAYVNWKHPDGGYDGAVWQGRGLTTALDVGWSARWRGLSAAIQPTLILAQNASFDLAPVIVPRMGAYAYPWRVIDLPQRFGSGTLTRLDPGQSEIAVDWRGARVSFGTRNLWWGPALRNAIVMSDNAPGFPHVSLGTAGPLGTRIGALELEWIWGRLGQSDWADPRLPTDDRFLTGAVLAYTPSFLPELTVGFTRVFQELVPEGGLPFGEYFLVFQGLVKVGQVSEERPEGNDVRDQLLSLFARWSLPESGFEAYVEWARNDHSWDFTDLFLEPEHSRGYTLGFRKVATRSMGGMVVLSGEHTTLESSPTFQVRPRPTFYEHYVTTQGYTHEGQLLGASVGPGGSAQFLGAEVYEPWGRWGVHVQRRVHDNDAYWVIAQARNFSITRHHASLDMGASGMFLRGPLELSFAPTLTREFNRYFEDEEGWNVNLALALRFRPGIDRR